MSDGSQKDGKALRFFDVREEPFGIYGLYQPKTEPYFHRLPTAVAEATSKNVALFEQSPAGGRIRFCTDSQRIAVRSVTPDYTFSNCITDVSRRGFDLYETQNGKEIFLTLFPPVVESPGGCEVERSFQERKMRELTLNLPLHTKLTSLEIGIEEDARLLPAPPYAIEKPVVYYGSSITHGVCATRPGLTYEAVISRKLNCDYVNLGFSGSCKAEPAIVEYIASMKMSAFVCDYDHNAPDAEYLRQTHERVYRTVREMQPELPILLVSKPDYCPSSSTDQARRAEIIRTYVIGMEEGDRNLWFVDGASFYDTVERGDCTVDGCHPNDLGFHLMAEKIGSVLQNVLKKI